MTHVALLGTATALIVGIFVGLQGIVAARLSLADNAISTGFVMYIAGGIVGAMLLAALYPTINLPVAPVHGTRLWLMVFGGIAGVVIVCGSAYAFAHISPAAAVALIIFGQMFLALLADSFGWTGQAPQAIDLKRVAGLVLLAGSIWLLMPHKE